MPAENGQTETLTVREAADRLGLSRTRVMKLIANGTLPGEKEFHAVGGSRRTVRRITHGAALPARPDPAPHERLTPPRRHPGETPVPRAALMVLRMHLRDRS